MPEPSITSWNTSQGPAVSITLAPSPSMKATFTALRVGRPPGPVAGSPCTARAARPAAAAVAPPRAPIIRVRRSIGLLLAPASSIRPHAHGAKDAQASYSAKLDRRHGDDRGAQGGDAGLSRRPGAGRHRPA